MTDAGADIFDDRRYLQEALLLPDGHNEDDVDTQQVKRVMRGRFAGPLRAGYRHVERTQLAVVRRADRARVGLPTDQERAEVARRVTMTVKTFERPDVLRRCLATAREVFDGRIVVADDSRVPVTGLGDGVDVIPLPFNSGVPAGRNAALDAGDGRPTLVCLQAGNVHSGAFDPFDAAIAAAHDVGAWVHVDGAFGLFAGASPRRRHLLAGADRADSWATDAHKTLNVPYDCGLAIVGDRAALRAAMGMHGDYLIHDAAGEPFDAFAGGYPVPPLPGQSLPPSPRAARRQRATAAISAGPAGPGVPAVSDSSTAHAKETDDE